MRPPPPAPLTAPPDRVSHRRAPRPTPQPRPPPPVVIRSTNSQSVLGTYLDPLADKVLIACVAAPLAIKGLLPSYAVAVFLLRDGGLILGAAALRLQQFQYAWPGTKRFFQTDPIEDRDTLVPPTAAPASQASPAPAAAAVASGEHPNRNPRPDPTPARSEGPSSTVAAAVGSARAVQPHLVSKVNTCLQIALGGVALCLGAALDGSPSYAVDAVDALCALTADAEAGLGPEASTMAGTPVPAASGAGAGRPAVVLQRGVDALAAVTSLTSAASAGIYARQALQQLRRC